MHIFWAILLVAVVVVAGLRGLGLISGNYPWEVRDIDEAADVMGSRMALDRAAMDALNKSDWGQYDAVNRCRKILAENTQSQGFVNDDSSRWLPSGKAAYQQAVLEMFEKAVLETFGKATLEAFEEADKHE